MKAIERLLKSQDGTNGLDTAIILIAFVTVAAVFGYAVLSAGLFSAERGKETIYAGLNEAKSNFELSGSVIGLGDNVTFYPINMLGIIKFTVKNAIAGNPIDMTPNGMDPRGVDQAGKNKCVISLTTSHNYINNMLWTYVPVGYDNGNNLLETGEQFEITVDINDLTLSGGALTIPDGLLQANDTFTLQVKPAIGSTITIQRQLPAAITPVMDLH